MNDAVDSKVKRILTKYDLPVRVYHHPKTLRNMLKNTGSTPQCHLTDCPVKEPKLCNASHCVYRLTCLKCAANYVGSSVRPLHLRIREHYTKSNSSVYAHRIKCKSAFGTEIVTRETDTTSLRIAEAIIIRREKPNINSKQEICELNDLIF